MYRIDEWTGQEWAGVAVRSEYASALAYCAQYATTRHRGRKLRIEWEAEQTDPDSGELDIEAYERPDAHDVYGRKRTTYRVYYRDDSMRVGELCCETGIWQYAYRQAADVARRWRTESWVHRWVERPGETPRIDLMARFDESGRVPLHA